jgi:hypothetical protein
MNVSFSSVGLFFFSGESFFSKKDLMPFKKTMLIALNRENKNITKENVHRVDT